MSEDSKLTSATTFQIIEILQQFNDQRKAPTTFIPGSLQVLAYTKTRFDAVLGE